MFVQWSPTCSPFLPGCNRRNCHLYQWNPYLKPPNRNSTHWNQLKSHLLPDLAIRIQLLLVKYFTYHIPSTPMLLAKYPSFSHPQSLSSLDDGGPARSVARKAFPKFNNKPWKKLWFWKVYPSKPEVYHVHHVCPLDELFKSQFSGACFIK